MSESVPLSVASNVIYAYLYVCSTKSPNLLENVVVPELEDPDSSFKLGHPCTMSLTPRTEN